jgi:hypothetical protein
MGSECAGQKGVEGSGECNSVVLFWHRVLVVAV